MATRSLTLRRAALAGGIVLAALAGPALARGDVVPGQLLVQYRPGATSATRADIRSAADVARVQGVAPRVDLVTAPAGQAADALAALRDDPRVAVATPNQVVQEQTLPNDPLFNQQWAPAAINLPTAWETPANRVGAVVAVVDSGIEDTHPDLAGQVMTLSPAPGPWATDVPANSHGTHVAGILGATGNNNTGVAGIAWGSGGGQPHLMDLRVIWNTGTATQADLLSALEYAGAHDARVVNGSLGGAGESAAARTLYKQVVDAHPNTLYVFAAGNTSDDLDTATGYFLPCEVSAVAPNAMCVAATAEDPTTHADIPATYTSHGSAVTVAAPGTSIYSTVRGGLYGIKSGTSMATPQVSGAASLLMQQRPALTGAQARAIIQATARPVPTLSGLFPGGGMLDVKAALDGLDPATLAGPTAFAISSPAPGSLGEQTTPTVTWTPSTSQALVLNYAVSLDGVAKATLPWSQTSWTSPKALSVGTHTVTITASDSLGRTASADVAVSVPAPVVQPAPVPVVPASPVVSKRTAAMVAAKRRYISALVACHRRPTRVARAACNRRARQAYVAAMRRAAKLPGG